MWVDACSVLSNNTMEYDLVRNIYLLDPINAKSLDGFVRNHSCMNCIVVDQACTHAPSRQYCWAFDSLLTIMLDICLML
jgi:hypothetical protein